MNPSQVKIWTLQEALDVLSEVKSKTMLIRSSYIAMHHASRANGYDNRHSSVLVEHKKVKQALKYLENMHIHLFYPAFRGIALFPCIVHIRQKDNQLAPKEAFFIYRDSIDTIEHFTFKDSLMKHKDLYGIQLPVPENWHCINSQQVVEV